MADDSNVPPMPRSWRHAPPHWLPGNKTTRLPRRHVIIDAEAHERRHKAGTVQTFRLAVAAFVNLRPDRNGVPRWATESFHDTASLWRWVDARTARHSRTVVVAHNLAYDLRITDALNQLPALGWEMTMVNLDGTSAWASWRRGDRAMVMVDSWSWCPASLVDLARDVGMAKPVLPSWEAPDAAWLERCAEDVRALANVWLRIMRWLEADDMGSWKPTGAGQAWAAFRHRHLAHKVLVHDDGALRATERRAAWSGRCEAWRWGQLPGGPWTEWDFHAAYATVCRDLSVPTKYVGHGARMGQREWSQLRKAHRVLTDVTVTTSVPVVPALRDRATCWPVGTFETTLWDDELQLVLDAGGTFAIRDAWVYRAAPVLADWARWCLSVIDAPDGTVDPIVQRVVKHWSRALVGRFGSRWTAWQPFGTSDHDDVRLGGMTDLRTGEATRLLQLGRRLYTAGAREEGADALPQVMATVMAATRVRLWRAMGTAGLDHVAYVDTDSLVTDPEGSRRLSEAVPDALRVKRTHRALEVIAPRQLVADGLLRASGVPRQARRLPDGRWHATVWRQLASSVAAGEPDRVTLRPRTVRLSGRDARRQHLPDGLTAPFTLP